MLKNLFGRARAEPAADYAVPPDTTVYAIGDVHGRLDLLRDLEARIADDANGRDAKRRVIVYLGDFVDRGYESRGVVDHLIAGGPDGFERKLLMGNHEEYLIRFLRDPSVGPSWMANGGIETMMSYGVETGAMHNAEQDIARVQADFRSALPDEHREFLSSLPVEHREGGYLFVHAGIRPGVALDDQDPEDLMWIRGEFLDDTRDHGVVVVHGHTVVDDPVDRPNRIGVDTGAYATGRLTAVVLSDTARDFIST